SWDESRAAGTIARSAVAFSSGGPFRGEIDSSRVRQAVFEGDAPISIARNGIGVKFSKKRAEGSMDFAPPKKLVNSGNFARTGTCYVTIATAMWRILRWSTPTRRRWWRR